jgi:pilus assembly protein CpaB
MNTRALIVSAVVGVLTVVLLTLYLHRLEVETSGGGPVAVLAAVKPLEPGTVITPDMLAVKVIPQAYVESRSVKKGDLQRIVGVRVESAVKPQQTLMWTDLALGDQHRQLSELVQVGMRAVGIRAANDDAHFGLIRPGDRVDVYSNLPKPNNDKEHVSVLVVQNVLVLAMGMDTGGRDTLGAPRSNDRVDQLLTLSVNPQQLQLVSLAAERGKLTVGLRNPNDHRNIEGVQEVAGDMLLVAPDKRPSLPNGGRPVALTPQPKLGEIQ